MRVYYWIHHTGLEGGNTGVQRVVRSLASGLVSRTDVDLIPVRWCAETQSIVRASAPWVTGLARFNGPNLRTPAECDTPLHLTAADKGRLEDAWLLIPEVTHLPSPPHAPNAPLALALDQARYYGMRTATIFYDIIPLRTPGYGAMAPDHALYAQALAGSDVVIPISRTAGDDLKSWWKEQGYEFARLPPVLPILLPAEMPSLHRVTAVRDPTSGTLRLVAWGTVMARKNQLGLMRAVNRVRLRRPGIRITLDVVGAIEPSIEADVRAEADRSAGTICLRGILDDASLIALVRECDATAFLSLSEGFGLPVAESLWMGRPCLTSNFGSMAEIAADGGCLTVDPSQPTAIEAAIERLATDSMLRLRLSAEVTTRALDTCADYASSVVRVLTDLPLTPELAVLEGSRGDRGAAASFEQQGVRVRRFHWHGKTQTILPGARSSSDVLPAPGDGDLRGAWVLLPLDTAADLPEVMLIEDQIRGLGARLAVWVNIDRLDQTLIAALTTVDLVLFQSPLACETALAIARRNLERTTTVRYRYQVASTAVAVTQALAKRRNRICDPRFPASIKRIYYWCATTASQHFNSGIQRSTRMIGARLAGMGIELIPVKLAPTSDKLVMLSDEEADVLALWGGPLPKAPVDLPADLGGEWLLIWEVPLPLRPDGSNPARLAKSLGMRVAAVCHDLLVHKLSELYSKETLAAFSEYWAMFSEVDVVLPNSWSTCADLQRYMADQGRSLPAVVTCTLAGDLPGVARVREADSPNAAAGAHFLAVGTREPRKNYLRLVRAVALARAMAPGVEIKLTIVGRPAEYADLEAELELAVTEVGGIQLAGHVTDEVLEGLYRQCHATVYASYEEGFGLPPLESAWRARPCLCHDGSALVEISRGGGTLAVDMLDERQIAQGLAALATDEVLYRELCRQATTRPIRTWRECAEDVLLAMKKTAAGPGWSAPVVRTGDRRALLTCAISTYNRAGWLKHSLDRLLKAAAPWRDSVEVVVCDNASTDETPRVISEIGVVPGFRAVRNDVNVGMLGNLGMTARASRGEYIWILGDDDLLVDGALEQVLTGLERHRDVEMAYMNYSYTLFNAPEELADPAKVIRDATPIAYGGPNRRVDRLRDVAGLNENQFTAIYACAFRADHAMRAYQQDTQGAPFSSLLTCVPSSVYALSVLVDRPAWWVGQPAVVVNMNVSWLRWALLWHLERMHDLFDASEMAGIDPSRLDRYRHHHVHDSGQWVRAALLSAEDAVRTGVSIDRFLERAKHIESFAPQIPLVYRAYAEAWAAGRVVADHLPPDELFARHGLLDIASGLLG